ncbi:hypothetical protein M758_4G219700 [Ceratodon purpureus]|nr:hypothetical protein M758_4G219700 [Ceratodon purpureus]
MFGPFSQLVCWLGSATPVMVVEGLCWKKIPSARGQREKVRPVSGEPDRTAERFTVEPQE